MEDNHEQQVKDFLEEAKRQDPVKYKQICEAYPIITRAKLSTIWKKEITSGLVGLEPCRISPTEATKANIDSSFYDE